MDVLEQKQVTTRKVHRCWGCCVEFPAKTRLWFTKTVDGGSIARAYWCNRCWEHFMEHHDDIDPYNDGISQGDILTDIQEYGR